MLSHYSAYAIVYLDAPQVFNLSNEFFFFLKETRGKKIQNCIAKYEFTIKFEKDCIIHSFHCINWKQEI